MKPETAKAVNEVLVLAREGYNVKLESELFFVINGQLELFPARRFYKVRGTEYSGNYTNVRELLNKFQIWSDDRGEDD